MVTIHPVQFCDLALKSDKDTEARFRPDGTVIADWFAIGTVARVGVLVYILDVFRAQIPFPEQVKALIREHHHWKSTKIGIENIAYQWALGQAAWDKGLPVVPVKYPGDHLYRAQLATPHFETGRVKIRAVNENGVLVPHPAMKRFIREACDMPYGENDDCVDAIVGAVLMCTSEEFLGREYAGEVSKGFGIAIAGGTGAVYRGDPFDVHPSFY